MGIKNFECGAISEMGGIFIEHTGCSKNTELFYHDFISVSYAAYGIGIFECEGNIVPVHEGNIFVVNPDIVHRFQPVKRLEYMELFHCYFYPHMIGDTWSTLKELFPDETAFFDLKTPYIVTEDNIGRSIRNIMVRMLDEVSRRNPGYKYTLKNCFSVLMTDIFRNRSLPPSRTIYSPNKTVDEVIRYINYHISCDISVREIAAANHISESYLCRLFKKNTGMTITGFINKLKTDRVKDILKNTDRSIENIGDYVNCSTSYLKSIFKKNTGMTMNAYRAKHRRSN